MRPLNVFKKFLVEEDGGLLSGVLGLAGSILSRPKRTSGVQSTLEAARGAIEAQEKYGINALELIRSGSAGTSAGHTPRVGSTAMMANAFDAIEGTLTGREAQEAENLRLRNALMREDLDNARRTKLGHVGASQDNAPQAHTVENYPVTVGSTSGEVGDPNNLFTSSHGGGLGVNRPIRIGEFRDSPLTSGVSFGDQTVSVLNEEAAGAGLDEALAFGAQAVPQMAYGKFKDRHPAEAERIEDAWEWLRSDGIGNQRHFMPGLTGTFYNWFRR